MNRSDQSRDLILTLHSVRFEIQDLREREAELVPQIVDIYGPEGEEGSQTTNESFAKVKVTKPTTYSMQNKDGETMALCHSLDQADQIRYFSWKPTLNRREFKKLEEICAAEGYTGGPPQTANQTLLCKIMDLLTIKSGKPQVKIELPE